MMEYLRQRAPIIAGTAALFLVTLVANELLFPSSEYVRGANWIYLPAGMQLLCTLLFGEAGAIGMLCAAWISCIFLYFPNDPVRSLMYGTISALAPYLIYLFATRVLGLRTSPSNLTARRLLFLIVLYAIASPLLHQLWLAMQGEIAGAGKRFVVMVVGDLSGSLIVIYTIKVTLWLMVRLAPLRRRPGDY
ncbi:hypothetical protein [Caballeronia grimmiae]|uniref:Rod shape-determining protein MreD n=2 Tax=Caballeronia grimmiae TaxID=1071679 RepID=A0ABQ1RAI6_9BURK|nr:hypothetical protein [Caballeronia grimmiae]GGD64047.1 hypothetical protein GCM10010985_17650 [Caballeronia grimmiae]